MNEHQIDVYAVPTPLERNVLKRELFEVTGRDHVKALILNQFLYWSKRVRDFDKLLAEESKRMQQDGEEANVSPTNGWIYKKAEELAEEAMLNLSPQTIGRHIDGLIKQGYLLWRHNPEHKWDRTKQYRVNFRKLQFDLHKLGYPLEGFSFLPIANSKMENGYSMMENQSMKIGKAISEITTETTYREKDNNDNRDNGARIQVMNNNRQTTRLHKQTNFGENELAFTNLDYLNEHKNKSVQAEPLMSSIEPTVSPFSPSGLEVAATQTGVFRPVGKQQLIPNNDPYAQVDNRMSQHLGRIYMAKQEDYRAIKQLLENQVPLDFMLAGIDYTFANFGNREINSFGYCAKVITQQWALEIAKQAEVKPLIWDETLKKVSSRTHSDHTQGNGGQVTVRHDKYETFYSMFPG